jgi:Flp pilus assembly protein CpaB
MKMRGFVLALALLLALGATGAVFLYVQGVRNEAEKTPSGDLVAVIVPKSDIPGGSALDPLIERGSFSTVRIPKDALVQGVVTDLSQLRGRTTSATILQGEQVTAARLQGSVGQVSNVGLQPGYQAVSLELDMPQGGGGFIQPGDHVTIYGTLSDVNIIKGSLKDILSGKAASGSKKQSIGDFTVTVVPDVRVLKASSPAAAEKRGSATSDVQFLLELKPEDAQKVVFAKEKGSIWIALLHPGDNSSSLPPVNVIDLLVAAKVRAV